MKKILSFICLLCLLFNTFLVVKALNSYNLYDETNTFNSYLDENGDLQYDLNKENDNKIDNKTFNITILNHGLGGDASNFTSNSNYKFGYNSNSIVTDLYRRTNASVLVLKIKEHKIEKNNSFKKSEKISCVLYDITNELERCIKGSSETEFILNNELEEIPDNKNYIVLFDGLYVFSENRIIYDEFNYAASDLLYKFKKKIGKIPQINLIGFSRGGVINMQYCLDHPRIVNKMISISTPYCSTTSGEIDYYFLDSYFCGKKSEFNLIDENKYLNMLNRWNDGYCKYGYDKVKVIALGGYSTLDYLERMFEDAIDNTLMETLLSKGLVNLLKWFMYYNKYSIYKNTKYGQLMKIISQININNSKLNCLIKFVFKELTFDVKTKRFYLYNDGLIDLNSQLGICKSGEYKGFTRVVKCFDVNNTNFYIRVSNAPAVIHNMTPYDSYFRQVIISNLT